MIVGDWKMIEPVDAVDALLRVAPLIMPMARTLRAEPSPLRIAIRFLAGAHAPGHQAAAAVSRPREQARVYVSR